MTSTNTFTSQRNKTLFLFSAFAFLICYTMFSQAPSIEWQKCLGGSLVETTRCFIPTSDNGYILAGYSISSDGDVTENKGGRDAWIVKLDSQANIQWQKSYGGSNGDEAMTITETADGGYIFAGYTQSNDGDVIGASGGSQDGWIVKLNSSGSIEWQKVIGNSFNYETIGCIISTNDGGYGVISSNGTPIPDIVFTKLNNTGVTEWVHTYGGSLSDGSSCVKNTPDGGYIICAGTYSNNGNVTFNHGDVDAWVIKTDNLGVIQWQKTYGGSQGDSAMNIELTSDNGYILCGQSSSNDGDVTFHNGPISTKDAWIVKLNSIGNIEWQKTFGGTEHEFYCNIKQLPNDEGYIALFHTYSSNGNVTDYHGFADFWIVRLNSVGQLQWQKTLGGIHNDYPIAIYPTNDFGYIVAGDTASFTGQISGNHGQSDSWIVKLAADPLSLQDFESAKISISPNPASEHIQINTTYEILNKMIYDQLGRVIFSSATSEKQVDVSSLTKGIYFIEIENSNGKTDKLKLIKE